MNAQQIREALVEANIRHDDAIAAGDIDKALEIDHARMYLQDWLVQEIMKEDPYATEADIRYFEGWAG